MSGPYIDIPALQNGKKAEIRGAILPDELIAQHPPINQYNKSNFALVLRECCGSAQLPLRDIVKH